MKFDIPKITRPIRLSEYAAEFGELEIQVWVNPPARLLDEYNEIVDKEASFGRKIAVAGLAKKEIDIQALQIELDATASRLVEMFAELWSQGPEETQWSEDEVRNLVEEKQNTDPNLWMWLRNRTIKEIGLHRSGVKKN